jgi:hypothetical protein
MNMNSDYPIKARKPARNNDLLETLLAAGSDHWRRFPEQRRSGGGE